VGTVYGRVTLKIVYAIDAVHILLGVVQSILVDAKTINAIESFYIHKGSFSVEASLP